MIRGYACLVPTGSLREEKGQLQGKGGMHVRTLVIFDVGGHGGRGLCCFNASRRLDHLDLKRIG